MLKLDGVSRSDDVPLPASGWAETSFSFTATRTYHTVVLWARDHRLRGMPTAPSVNIDISELLLQADDS